MRITEAQLLDYLEGRLPPNERAQVEDYLVHHPEVRDELEQMRALASALRAMDMPAPPPGFAKRVSARLDQAIAQRSRFRTNVLRLRAALVGLLTYVALLIAGGGVFLWVEVPFLRPVAILLQVLASVGWQMLEPFATLARVLLAQPLGWLALLSALSVVMVWVFLLGQVFGRNLKPSAS